jgi:hypothetical protein
MLLSEYRREKHLYSQIPEDQIKLQIIHRSRSFNANVVFCRVVMLKYSDSTYD